MRKSEKKEIKRRAKEILKNLLKNPRFKKKWFKKVEVKVHGLNIKNLSVTERSRLRFLEKNGYKIIFKTFYN